MSGVTKEQMQEFLVSSGYQKALLDGQRAVTEAQYAAYVEALSRNQPGARQPYDIELNANEPEPNTVQLLEFLPNYSLPLKPNL